MLVVSCFSYKAGCLIFTFYYNQNKYFPGNRCPPLQEIVNATPDKLTATNGTIITITCDKGFVLENGTKSQTITCDGQGWIGQIQTCLCKEHFQYLMNG